MKKIVVVDDSNFMRLMLKNIITKIEGFEIVGEGKNGREAIELCQELKPDIITLDITMPVLDGIDAIKEIKKHNPDIKILMVSAMGQRHLIYESVQAGAKDFIVKPFKETKVIESLKKLSKM